YDAVPAAENLYFERRSRAVVFLTNRAGEARAKARESDAAHFFFEKKDEVWGRLPWLTYAAALHAKGRFVLNEVVRLLMGGDSRTAHRESDGGGVLLEEVCRYYEVLQLVQRAPWAEPALDGWSARLGAKLQPIYEAKYCTPADVYWLHEPFLESLGSLQGSLAATTGVTVHPSLSGELDDLSSRLAAIWRTGVLPTVRKFTDIEFPHDCLLDADALLILRITDEGMIGVLDLEFDDSRIDLLVMVSGDGFEIPDATSRLSVPRTGNTEDLEFRVIPRATGDQYLHVHFYRDTAAVGSLIVHSTVHRVSPKSQAS
ncbi:MAG TPA: hypothetical protein VGO40_22955, partial [Longimicrobium sp.]|nr:hypothetical protein [Longimicrobium sp.]